MGSPSVPGRAAYAVTIESGQHGSFRNNGVSEKVIGDIVVIVESVMSGDGDAVRVRHDDFL